MSDKSNVKTFHPQNRIAALVRRKGGKSRQEAIEGATQRVEKLRGDSTKRVSKIIAGIQEVMAANPKMDAGELAPLMSECDSAINLAGTFGYDTLVIVLKSLADLLNHFTQEQISNADAIAVHVQALVLCDPTGPVISDEDRDKLLERLTAVRTFFGCTPPMREDIA